MNIVDNIILETNSKIEGLPCTRKSTGSYKSLHVGFGGTSDKPIRNRLGEFYREWEIGTYSAAWRIVKCGQIILGSRTPVDSEIEMIDLLQRIDIGDFIKIEQISVFDISIHFSERTQIDFMCSSSDDDEMLHIFGPEHLFLGYNYLHGWQSAKSNVPYG